LISQQTDTDTTQVTNVFTEREFAVYTQIIERLIAAVLLDELSCARLELRQISVCPPVAHNAVTIKGAARIIKAMADFVTNHGADATIINSIFCAQIKERRLQDGGWKNNFVQRWVVIGIYGLRRYAPFGSINRTVMTIHQALILCECRPLYVPVIIVGRYIERRIISPLIRVSDLRCKLG